MPKMKASQEARKTILLVDDDVLVRKLVSKILADGHNYNILMANDGALGLAQSRKFDAGIDLLLTDFEMPGMSGIELATAMAADRPNLKVLLMTGFPGGILVLNEGWHFLQKPFIPSQLRSLIAGLISPDRPSRFAKQ